MSSAPHPRPILANAVDRDLCPCRTPKSHPPGHLRMPCVGQRRLAQLAQLAAAGRSPLTTRNGCARSATTHFFPAHRMGIASHRRGGVHRLSARRFGLSTPTLLAIALRHTPGGRPAPAWPAQLPTHAVVLPGVRAASSVHLFSPFFGGGSRHWGPRNVLVLCHLALGRASYRRLRYVHTTRATLCATPPLCTNYQVFSHLKLTPSVEVIDHAKNSGLPYFLAISQPFQAPG